MEKKICNACGIEKSVDSFYKCQNCRGGRLTICKICKINGIKVDKDHIIHPFNQMWRRPEESFFTLNRVTKKDYEVMWDLLEKLGYDTTQNVHQQFVDKVNSQTDKPVKYRKPQLKNQPRWLSNGEMNPKLIHTKKDPTE